MWIKGYDTKGHAVTVNFDVGRIFDIWQVDVYERSVVIYDRRDPDISISLRDWQQLKPLLRPDAKIYEGGAPVTNHVQTIYDMAAYQARALLSSLSSLPDEQTPDAMKAAIESKGFVWHDSRGWHIPEKPKAAAPAPVQKTMF